MRLTSRLAKLIFVPMVAILASTALTSCSSEPHLADTVRVPADASTISQAMDEVAPGGLVLVDPGTYTETVTISKQGVTLRGTDRNGVVIDGEGVRPEGVVVVADGVRVENLTVHSHTFNGVLVTGLHDSAGARAHGIDGYSRLDPDKFPPIDTFSIDHVTSYNNGLYGIYAFDSRHGSITDSYASGSADSGFYVGQCTECDIVVSGNTAENNAVGFETANASDSLVVVGNSWSNNRIGLTLLSNYQEAFVPQRAVTVVGNLISNNVSANSPNQADGGFGVGIGIKGSTSNVITDNRISGNPAAGILLSNAEDLPAVDNVIDSVFENNGVDVANVSLARAQAHGNCISGAVTVLPPDLVSTCSGQQASVGADSVPAVTVPKGMSFLRVPAPPAQPDLGGDLSVIPDALPATPVTPDLSAYGVPAADWRPAS